MVGKTISHYKILSEVGRGGMGVVYKAEDTKLERPVALKFLAAHAIEDPEHKARFVREAKAAARLDHQNICPVYEIDEADGQTFLAMAFLEGQTLKDKIAERPLKLDEALDIAVQTAQGLKAAHQNEVVHRDIKPANLMLTEEGQVKVMDFGLAQLAEGSKLTKTQTMLGTPAYMSPEQARREPTDQRTDVWSLGVVIYEMVTGRLPFEGERQQAVLYAIAQEDPEPITALRVGVPTELDRIVGKAMEKDAGERYLHVEEMIVDLRSLGKKLESGESTIGLQSGVASQQTAAPVAASGETVPKRKHLMVQVLFAVTAIALLALAFVHFRETPPERPLIRFALSPNADVGHPVISPSGRHIAYVTSGSEAEGELWIQDLDSEQPRQIRDSEGAQYPFWSPDSQFLGFFAGDELRKVPVGGGLASVLCKLPDQRVRGGAWSPDSESVVFSAGLPAILYEVPSRGGQPKLVLETVEGRTGLSFPHFLPSEAGRRVLLIGQGRSANRTTVVYDLDRGEHQDLEKGSRAFYSATGHILYHTRDDGGDLWALPFSIDTLRASGEAFPLAQSASHPTATNDGVLVYLSGVGAGQDQLVWRDRKGQKVGVIGQPQLSILHLTLSPDESRVAVSAFEGSVSLDIWIHEIDRPVTTRLTTHEESDAYPVWSPSGDLVAYNSRRSEGGYDIFSRRADGTGEAIQMLTTPLAETPLDWSADGKYVIFGRRDPETNRDLWFLQRKSGGDGYEEALFLQTEFRETGAKLSPNARYVAYVSDRSVVTHARTRYTCARSLRATGSGGSRKTAAASRSGAGTAGSSSMSREQP